MGTHFSQAGLFPAGLKGLPATTALYRGRLPACFWRGKNVWRSQGCWQRPHRLAPKSEPSGGVREGRTVPGRGGSAQWQPLAGWNTRHRLGDPGEELQGIETAGKMPLKFSTSLNSRCFLPPFCCFPTCVLQGLLGFIGLVGEPGIVGEKVSGVEGNV